MVGVSRSELNIGHLEQAVGGDDATGVKSSIGKDGLVELVPSQANNPVADFGNANTRINMQAEQNAALAFQVVANSFGDDAAMALLNEDKLSSLLEFDDQGALTETAVENLKAFTAKLADPDSEERRDVADQMFANSVEQAKFKNVSDRPIGDAVRLNSVSADIEEIDVEQDMEIEIELQELEVDDDENIEDPDPHNDDNIPAQNRDRNVSNASIDDDIENDQDQDVDHDEDEVHHPNDLNRNASHAVDAFDDPEENLPEDDDDVLDKPLYPATRNGDVDDRYMAERDENTEVEHLPQEKIDALRDQFTQMQNQDCRDLFYASWNLITEDGSSTIGLNSFKTAIFGAQSDRPIRVPNIQSDDLNPILSLATDKLQQLEHAEETSELKTGLDMFENVIKPAVEEYFFTNLFD